MGAHALPFSVAMTEVFPHMDGFPPAKAVRVDDDHPPSRGPRPGRKGAEDSGRERR
jgi:hypothetical protein